MIRTTSGWLDIALSLARSLLRQPSTTVRKVDRKPCRLGGRRCSSCGLSDSSRLRRQLPAQDEETFSLQPPSYLRPDVDGKNRDYHLYDGCNHSGPGENTHCGSINKYQACLGTLTLRVSLQTDHRIGTTARVPQRLMITYTGMGTPPGQPIGVTVHFTQQPIREQLLSSKPRQKLLKIYHPDEAQKPRLPDPIVQPIAVMPLSRT
ncbi:hypothetical protein TNCV_1957161 [Trichonephila clavipes]|nr:hypothetical protein TNCV_1957161 [Trichonephila clavipes]